MSPDEQAGPINVLFVDDHLAFLEMVADKLQDVDDNLEIYQATNTEEGLDRLTEHEIDCIVADYSMDERDGIEFLETVRDRYGELPFIVYTGKGSEEVAADAISLGVTDYIRKETTSEHYSLLGNRIVKAVESHRTRQSLADSEQEFRQIHDRITDGFFSVDTDWQYTYVNEAGARMVDRSADELIGQTVWDAFPNLLDSPFEDALRTAMESQETTSIEEYFPAQDAWYDVRVYGDENGLSIYFKDVTEKKQREQELRETTRRLNLALDATDTGVWEWNMETDEVSWSESLERLLGIEPGAFVGTYEAHEDYLHPDDIQTVEQAAEEALQGDGSFEAEFRMIREDGETIWVRGRGEHFTEDGPERMIGTTTDITAQKQREQEYQLTIDFLEKLYDTATSTELSTEAKITRLLEIGPETVGLPSGYLTRIETSAHDESDGTQRVIKASGDHELLQPGNSCPLSESYCRKTIEQDGITEVHDAVAEGWEGDPAFELFNLGCYIGTAITVKDEVYGTVFFAREEPRETPFTAAERTFVRLVSQLVSYELERREAQADLRLGRERMEFALEATNSIIWAIDLETEESTDYGPVEQVLGTEPTDMPDFLDRVVHPEDRSRVEQVFDAVRQGDTEVFDVEFRTAPDIGGATWVSSTGYVQTGSEDAVPYLVGLATDITERKQREAELTRQNERLEEFASIVSHDLRNPLTVAEGNLELVQEDVDHPGLEAVERAHERMRNLIEDLLLLTRGEASIDAQHIQLREIAEQSWQNVETAEASLAIETDGSIKADEKRAQQLFENLFRNAVEHGGDEVSITVDTCSEGFYVEDDGPGIPESERERVLEPGYSTSESGTGFGLSIVNDVAEDHDWDIEIRKGTDGGARFHFKGVETQ